MKKILSNRIAPFLVLLFSSTLVVSETPPLTLLTDPAKGMVHGRKISFKEEDGRTVATMGKGDGAGVAWFKEIKFSTGVIECDLRQDREPADLNFVGLAFNGVDGNTYESIYFRPGNFHHPDAARRARAVQYISVPGNDWFELREGSPGVFEKAAVPPPQQDAWFHCRIVVEAREVRVYLDGSKTPCLTVQRLTDRQGGWVGLWVGNQSGGRFANLKILPDPTSIAEPAPKSSKGKE